MQIIRSIEFYSNNKEENLPQYAESFPYICTEARLHEYQPPVVPWHWHAALELFYIEKGELEYTTPGGKFVFAAGTAGLVNSNVLHTTRPLNAAVETVQRLHIFDASYIAGPTGSQITQKYITPLLTCPGLEIIAICPNSEKEKQLIDLIKGSFKLNESFRGYELLLRNCLSEIWIHVLNMIDIQEKGEGKSGEKRESLKAMMIYIHEHYAEKISVEEIADAGFLSVRECYRVFHEGLHCTPMKYLSDYRIQMACQMLVCSTKTLTEIGYSCGFGSSSYFNRSFQQNVGCSPSKFRNERYNREKLGQKN